MAAIRELEQLKIAPPSYPVVEFRPRPAIEAIPLPQTQTDEPLPNPIAQRDWEIVQSVQDGDTERFGELYDLYCGKVYRSLYYRMGKSKEDAEDLTSLVFTKAFNAIGRYKYMGRSFGAWVLSIGDNLLIDYYRAKKETISTDYVRILADDKSNPVVFAEKSFENTELRQAINKLKREQQTVVVMRFIYGLEYGEIAGVLKKSEGNCRIILHRAILELREIMGAKRLVANLASG